MVTGGSGYLGSHLVSLAARSWHVAATFHAHPERLAPGPAYPLDVRNAAAVTELVARLRPTTIIHTAAEMTTPEAMQAVIVAGTRHVAAAAAAAGARLVVLSTDAVFDGEHAPYAEADLPRPITAYGQAKAGAERAAAALCPGAAVVRTSLILGFRPLDPRSASVIDALRAGQPITLFTDEIRCPVWVEQLAAALLELAAGDEAQIAGVWHIAGPQALSRYDIGVRLARACGLDPAGLGAGRSRASGLGRPRDCTLRIDRARARLQTPLWDLDRVLAEAGPPRDVSRGVTER